MNDGFKREYCRWLFDQMCNNKHDKDPYVLKSRPLEFKKAKHNMQKIDELVSNLPSFYKLDIWDEYISQDIKATRAMTVGDFEFRNGPNGDMSMTMRAPTKEGHKRLYIYQPPRCGKTLAMEAYKQFCENMEGNKMNNSINKNLNDDLNNIHWVVDSWEVEDRPVAGAYRPCDFKVSLSGRFNNNAARQINFYRLTNSLADKLNGKTRNANPPTIKNVIFNDPATIVFWTDNTKTVVKCQEGEKFDPEKGITMAFFKKTHGNKGSYFNDIKKWADKYEEYSPSVDTAECFSAFADGFKNSISSVFDSLPCQKSNIDFLRRLRDAIDEVAKYEEDNNN